MCDSNACSTAGTCNQIGLSTNCVCSGFTGKFCTEYTPSAFDSTGCIQQFQGYPLYSIANFRCYLFRNISLVEGISVYILFLSSPVEGF